MPRKGSHGIDYEDDDYNEYDDYDDYDYECNATDKPSQPQKTVDRVGLWRCAICTYDNEENLSYCDICGAIRDPSINILNNSQEKELFIAVDGTCKNYGVSTMAKSLFASMPTGTPKTTILFPQLNDESLSKGAAPFKFDNPSPDDVVFAGKNTSKGSAKVSLETLGPSGASASVTQKNGDSKVQPTSKSSQSIVASIHANGSTVAQKSYEPTEGVSSTMQKLDLDKVSRNVSSSVSSRKTDFQSYKPEKWMSDQEQGSLKQLNLAIVGHVDSGKSTLSGRLLHLLGRISQKEMRKYEKEAKEQGKGSFAFAWAMDESPEERERGITMGVAVNYFDTRKYHIVLLDSPGHKDFVPNMISGASEADVAILVVDASVGSFEAGMGGNGGGQGQTREHAQLIRSFGVEHVVVVVNKMDMVGYSKERFDFIKSQLGSFLRSCQFKESSVAWIPASAIENQNLVRVSSEGRLLSWYRGPCLLDAIDSLQPPQRDISKPLRMPICDIRSHSSGYVAARGKLETGAIRNGSRVLVMPSGEIATVRSIERSSQICSIARAGDNVSVCLQGVDESNVIPGGILCHPDFPVAVATHLELRIFVLDVAVPVVTGSDVEFHTHHAKEDAVLTKIISVTDQKTKKTSKRRFLTSKQSAVVEVVLRRAVCVEDFSSCRALGRAFLRVLGSTIAVGTIQRIINA